MGADAAGERKVMSEASKPCPSCGGKTLNIELDECVFVECEKCGVFWIPCRPSTYKDYREVRQIVICGLSGGKFYPLCSGYTPYPDKERDERELGKCMYHGADGTCNDICARPEPPTISGPIPDPEAEESWSER